MLKKSIKLSVVIVILTFLLACSSKVKSPVPSQTEIDNGQMTFTSAELAVDALKHAAKNSDTSTLAMIFGPESRGLLNSGDKVADQDAIQDFTLAINEKQNLVKRKNINDTVPVQQVATLLVGNEGWPFPIPIIEVNNRWRFDTAKGKEEIINRRIGENELSVIKIANEYVIAQLEYYLKDRNGNGVREFAGKFFSSPGKKDGLYWEPVEGEALSPIGPLVALAADDGYKHSAGSKPQAFHGYNFRILTSQSKNARGGTKNYIVNGKMTGGFALLAYPAEWDISGAMTFIVGSDGVIYQKNLGPDTDKIAAKIKIFDPSEGWNPV